MIAAVLAQYLTEHDRQPMCIDTDPVNATLAGYTALPVRRIELMEGDEINPRKFDAMVELIAPTQADVIVDNGAASFVPLASYLISNQVPVLFQDMGHELIVHTVITGGQALQDTMTGFVNLVEQFPAEAAFVVWLNPYWGAVEFEGKTFEQMRAYTANKDRVSAIIHIPTLKAETYGRDLEDLLRTRRTFAEALDDPDLTIMTRQRLKIVQRQIFEQLNSVRM